MNAIVIIGIVLGTFCAMEFVAWFTHKYLMHKILWFFHKDHHNHEAGFFEKNDTFFLIFAIPSAYFFYSGAQASDYRIWIGLGIALYGLGYLLIHDIFIHQRIKWFRRTDNAYLRAIRKAHLVHHKHLRPEDGECFGMLLPPLKYFRQAKAQLSGGSSKVSGK